MFENEGETDSDVEGEKKEREMGAGLASIT